MLFGFLTCAFQLSAQTTSAGGRGMLRVFSAETVQRGSIFVNSFYQTFLQTTDSRGYGNDHTLQLGLTYGLTHSLELTAKLVPYQEDQVHSFSAPGDAELGVKWRTPFSTTSVATGLRGFVILPTARSHNVPFEPYSSGKISWGAMAMTTLSLSGRYPLKIYANLGYLDHNLTTFFSNEITDQLLLGFGLKIPIHPFIMFTEYTGEIFINNPAVDFKDNSTRITYGFKFRGPFRTTVDVGVDVGLSRNLNPAPHPLVHDYADWKIFAGFNYQINTARVYGKPPVTAKVNSKEESKILEEIKKKREQAGQELEEMKKKLEEEEKKPENEN
jgi:hypothetical protein